MIPYRTLFPGLFLHKGGAAANGLLNALIAYWPGNEVNGDALDAHVNALHLTDVNTVTSNPGVVYPLARQYALFERHIRPGSDALLSVADTDFTLATWAQLDTKLDDMFIISKHAVAATTREYALQYLVGPNRLAWTIWDGTNVVGSAQANALGIPGVGVWYLLIGWHDSVANTCNIQINNGGIDSAAMGGIPAGTATPFAISNGAGWMLDGRVGPTAFWQSAPGGGGGVLDATKRSALWNGGLGLPYAAFTL